MTEQIMITSPKTYARFGGFFYLINIVLGMFSIAYVEGIIVVDHNPSTTANNIITHEFLFRLGIVGHIIILLTNFPLALIFYRLFNLVNKNATLLVVFFALVGTAVESANLLNQYQALLFLKPVTQITSFNQEQINEQAFTLLRLKTAGFNLSLIFYAFSVVSR